MLKGLWCILTAMRQALLLLSLASACVSISAAGSDVTSPSWGTPAQVYGPWIVNDSVGYAEAGPAFDGQGNAYELVYTTTFTANSASSTVAVVQSNGASGTWSAPQTIFTGSSDFVSCPAIVADPQGDVTVICEDYYNETTHELLAFRYTPASGWLPPVTLYQGGNPISPLFAVGDSAGDVVVAGGYQNYTTLTAAVSYVFSAATQTWSAPQYIAPMNPGESLAYDSNLSANHAGTAIFFAYIEEFSSGAGIYAQQFNIATLSWNAPQAVPGSTGSSRWQLQRGSAPLPLAIDGAGVASLFYNLSDEKNQYFADVLVSRFENGAWGNATRLFESTGEALDMTNYASADANTSETACAAMGFSSAGVESQYVFLYDGTKWSTQVAAQYATNLLATNAIAFTGTGNNLVLVYPDAALESVYYDGTGWSAPVALTDAGYDMPGVLGTNALGQTVLNYSGVINQNSYFLAAWLLN
jgi:hypothetical protein